MAVTLQELIAWAPALAPNDDIDPAGGGIDLQKMMDFTDPASPQMIASDAAEIGFANWLVSGLEADGITPVAEIKQPNGLTPAILNNPFDQILDVRASNDNQVADVAIEAGTALHADTAQEGGPTRIRLASGASNIPIGVVVRLTGGTGANQIRRGIAWNDTTKDLEVDRPWDTEPDNTTTYRVAHGLVMYQVGPNAVPITHMRRLFQYAAGRAAGQGSIVYYDKFFFFNGNLTDNLSNCVVSMNDPTGKVRFGLALTRNDDEQIANRLTPPVGITFGTSPVAVPEGGTLEPENAIGVWVELTRDEGDPEIFNAGLEFTLTGDE